MANDAPSPDRGRLQRMIDAALPGGRVVSVRRLRGGMGAYVHAVGVSFADGTRTSVVLRRRGGRGHLRTPEKATIEFQTLTILDQAGVPVPRPLMLDAEGTYFDCPSIMMSYAGRPIVEPRDVAAWVGGLADALLKVQAVTPDRCDLTFLSALAHEETHRRVMRPLPHSIEADPLANRLSKFLLRRVSGLDTIDHCVVHFDFWPGNTVWRRDRLSAVVDWSTAVVGDPRTDIAQCRVDLAMMHGTGMADAFLRAYCTRAGKPVADIWFFDILIGLDDALATFRSWIPGYHDLGLSHLTEEVVEARLRAFLMESLRRAEDSPERTTAGR
jgi:aminoglycoside phosphotransferase (APT) family kinase protein